MKSFVAGAGFLEPLVAAAAVGSDVSFWLGSTRDQTSNFSSFRWADAASAIYSNWLDHWNDTLDAPSVSYGNSTSLSCARILHRPSEAASSGVSGFLYSWQDTDCTSNADGYVCKYPTGEEGRLQLIPLQWTNWMSTRGQAHWPHDSGIFLGFGVKLCSRRAH